MSIAPNKFRPGTFAPQDTWFPLVHSVQVGRRPIHRAVHGQPVVFWRDNGRLRATEDLPGTPPARRRGGDYPLVERYGYAWICYGDPGNAAPELRRV